MTVFQQAKNRFLLWSHHPIFDLSVKQLRSRAFLRILIPLLVKMMPQSAVPSLAILPKHSTLELDKHDAAAHGPERDNTIVAPERNNEVDAPQVRGSFTNIVHF